MRVRVFDKEKNKYYKSEVYAIIDHGWYSRYLVLEPNGEKAYLKFIDYFDKSQSGPIYPVNINVITPEGWNEWISKKGEDLRIIKKLLTKNKGDIRFEYTGVPWVFKDSSLLAVLIAGKSIEINEAGYGDKILNSMIPEWNYVEIQKDVTQLMDTAYGFHDSCLKSLNYISGSKVLEDKSMLPMDTDRRVTMIYDSQWCQSIEMVFEGVIALNLRPAEDNCCSDLYGASVVLQDETIYFCDDYDESRLKEPENYSGTWIKAFNLRWRLIK